MSKETVTAAQLAAKQERIKTAEVKGLTGKLGIEFTKLELDCVEAEMGIGPDLHQPFGIMHGGVSLCLAESVASVGAWLNADEGQGVIGVEINANHLRKVKDGTLRAVAVPLHKGRTSQVWTVDIKRGEKLIAACRCTLMMVPLEM
jgi:1,4-dihydroxy-2-naphthoyl-CoA hydrolase